jgi:hypothetical protein
VSLVLPNEAIIGGGDMRNKKGAVPLLETFVVLIIILILTYFAFSNYLKTPFVRTPWGTYELSGRGKGKSSATVLDAAKINVEKLNQRMREQNQQLDQITR